LQTADRAKATQALTKTLLARAPVRGKCLNMKLLFSMDPIQD
jgi:hypothetical protein